MTLSNSVTIFRWVTFLSIPFQFLPSLCWLFYDLILASTSTSPTAWTDFINTISESLWLWVQALLHFPGGFWILLETLLWDDSLKNTDTFTIWFMRIVSWILLGYNGVASLFFSTLSLLNNWNDG